MPTPVTRHGRAGKRALAEILRRGKFTKSTMRRWQAYVEYLEELREFHNPWWFMGK